MAPHPIDLPKSQARLDAELLDALDSDDAPMAAATLSEGADPDARLGQPAAMAPAAAWAARRGSAEILAALVGAGADLDATDSLGRSALHLAALSGGADCMRILIAAGADPELADLSGQLPLHLAAAAGSVACARLLVAAGADLDPRTPNSGERPWRTPAMLSAQFGRLDCLAELLASGARPDLADGKGWGLSEIADRNRHGDALPLIRSATERRVLDESPPPPKVGPAPRL